MRRVFPKQNFVLAKRDVWETPRFLRSFVGLSYVCYVTAGQVTLLSINVCVVLCEEFQNMGL